MSVPVSARVSEFTMTQVYVPSTRGIVKQLLKLASDPENHNYIFKEKGLSVCHVLIPFATPAKLLFARSVLAFV